MRLIALICFCLVFFAGCSRSTTQMVINLSDHEVTIADYETRGKLWTETIRVNEATGSSTLHFLWRRTGAKVYQGINPRLGSDTLLHHNSGDLKVWVITNQSFESSESESDSKNSE